MKRTLLAFMMLIGLSTAAQVARADVSVDFFYDNLSGGNWIEVGDYGYCWQPDVAVNSSDWRPYADGYWAYTDEGWTWVSYEDFGWATYHYGRWAHLSDAGWVWVPGRDQDLEWGPAWVSWRTGGDYIGWAPLPPSGERVYEGRDINSRVDIDFDIGPAYYNFVETRYIGEPVLRERIFAPTQNITYINQTVNVTNITYKNKVVYNYGPDINVINQRASRPIQRLTIQRETNSDFNAVAKAGGLKTKVQGQSLVIAAPTHIARSTRQIAPPAVKSKVAKANLDTGWAGVGDAKAKEQFKQKLRSEDPNKIPPGTGAAASSRAATGVSPAGPNANVNAQAGVTPAVATPAASAAAGVNAEAGRGGKHNRNPGAAAAASVAPAVAASPAQTGVAGSTNANAGLERGKGGRPKNRQGEQNATVASPAPQGLTNEPATDVSGQGRPKHNGRRGDQLPPSTSAGATGAEVNPPATGVPGAGQGGGGQHNRREQRLPNVPEGQINGQSPTGVDSSQGQGGGRRERRLERQSGPVPAAPTSPEVQSQGAVGGRQHDQSAPPAVTGQPAAAGATEQGPGRRQGGGRKNQGEASPVPSPQ